MKGSPGINFFTFSTVISLAAWESPASSPGQRSTTASWPIYMRIRKELNGMTAQAWCLGSEQLLLPLATPLPDTMPIPPRYRHIWIWPGCLVALIAWKQVRYCACGSWSGHVRLHRFIRHPMYLGELTLRGVLWWRPLSPTLCIQPALVVLAAIQILRTFREEQIIAGYRDYFNRSAFA
jgi:hypothetical protein